jgi:uroporphyrinogen-III decarboxylase
MSEKQFRTFYWPGLKKALQASIDLGFVTMPFFEARFGDRLECLKELPRGKTVAVVEHMDVIPAKEMLRGHACILGKGPTSLKYSSVSEVEEYYKKMIDAAGRDGGFMLNIILPEKASKEDLQQMVQNIREYSRG